MPYDSESRIIELETRIALQEDLIQTLNRQVHEQQGIISGMDREISEIQRWLRALLPALVSPQGEEDVPPHY